MTDTPASLRCSLIAKSGPTACLKLLTSEFCLLFDEAQETIDAQDSKQQSILPQFLKARCSARVALVTKATPSSLMNPLEFRIWAALP